MRGISWMWVSLGWILIAASASAAGELEARFDAGGTWGMIETPPRAIEDQAPVDLPLQAALATTGGKPVSVRAKVWAEDLFGKPAGAKEEFTLSLPADGQTVKRPLGLKLTVGYYTLCGEFTAAGETVTRRMSVGVVPAHHEGLRPESFFASNTSGMRIGDELRLFQIIGMKVQRTHFQPHVVGTPPEPSAGAALNVDFREMDARLAELKKAGVWVLPIVGYSFEGTNREIGKSLGMHGPPRNYEEFVRTSELVVRHFPEVTTYEVWNEPWIFGWAWAGTPKQYCDLQKMWCEMALKVNPKLRILAGNSSMFAEDNIEPHPESWKGLLAGVTHHPYTGAGARTMREGAQPRSMDHGMVVSRRMGLPYYYLTEGGTEWREGTLPPDFRKQLSEAEKSLRPLEGTQKKIASTEAEIAALDARAADAAAPESDKAAAKTRAEKMRRDLEHFRASLPDLDAKAEPGRFGRAAMLSQYPQPSNNNVNAVKVVQYAVRAALVGTYQTNMQWDIGYGPDWTRSNTTFAVLTHFLEDRPIVADIWPENELITGAIFAQPSHVTDAVRALPRAKEFAARWAVPVPKERAGDATKVAVLWSNTGRSNRELDTAGTLTIADAKGLRAYDCTGREIRPSGGKLTVPFTEYPVYLTTDDLDVVALRDRIAGARIENVTAVNLYALSLLEPADRPQSLRVRVENQMNRAVKGTLVLALEGQGKASEVALEIPAAKLVEVAVPWPGVKASPQNEYAITLTARTDAGAAECRQILAAARFIKRTITVDGSLDDWKGATPVLLDSDRLASGIDLTQYLLNPHLERPTGTPEKKRIVARVYTAYDDANVYVAAEVNEDELRCPAGEPAVRGRGQGAKVTLPYKNGMPDGLGHIRYAGDCLMIAFGFRDRVPGWGRPMDDPYAWKGHFYDTDYHYVAHVSKDGDQLMRQWAADTPRRTAYQTEPREGVGPVPGAKIVIKRDEDRKLTTYEMAIPRRELALFDPSQGRCRFGFILCNNEKLGREGGLQWSEAAGVFDHWYATGSFAPSWCPMLPCQTFFGIEK